MRMKPYTGKARKEWLAASMAFTFHRAALRRLNESGEAATFLHIRGKRQRQVDLAYETRCRRMENFYAALYQ